MTQNKVSMTEREKVYGKFYGHCAYCGKKITIKEMQIDHYYPKHSPSIAKYHGFDCDSLENKMPSCRRCNHYKREEQPENFRKQMKTLHERISNIYINKVGIDYGIIKITPFNGQFYFEYLFEMEQKYCQPETVESGRNNTK